MFRVEITKATHRWRTWLLAVLGMAVPGVVILGLVLATGRPEAGEGPPFLAQILNNGLFTPLTSLALVLPFFLPLATSLLAGDAVAGEASSGTLRYLLVRPVGRVRLVVWKYAAVMSLVAAGVLLLVLAGLAIGTSAFGVGPLPTLSGITIDAWQATGRLLVAAGYAILSMASLAAIGLFISVLTESGPGATAGTLITALISQILDGLPTFERIHPYLFTHQWLAFVDLFRQPVEWGSMVNGVVLSLVWAGAFLSGAIVVFCRKDVTS